MKRNNRNHSTRLTKWIGIMLCSIALMTSCKENTILPPDLVPAVDNINTFQQDSFTVITHSIYKDSLLTGGVLNSTNRNADADFAHAIGCISSDAVFGRTVASAYVQVRQPAPSFAFSGTNQIIDSVVLGINYLQPYGDTLTAPNQIFFLYRSKENLSRDSAYYEFNETAVTNQDILTSQAVKFNTFSTDSPIVNGLKLRPQLRFLLPGKFGDSLLAQTSTGAFADYSTFLNWLGGFYVVPDSNVGATLGYFDTDNTTMYVYYRSTNTSTNLQDTLTAVFPFDPTYCNRFNHITRNYTGKPSANFVNTGSVGGDSLIFVEGEPGLAALVTFPYIGNFPNAIINKAELTFTVVSPFSNYFDTTSYNIPPQFQIIYVNENGEDEVLEDYLLLGAQRVGAYRGSFALAGFQRIQYKMNISHTIQNAVTLQQSNFALKISGARNDYPASNRVVLRGSGSAIALEKPKLNIIFTKIQR